MRRALPLLLLLALLPACDTEAEGPVVFGGVELAARGDARLAVEGGRLVVSGLDGTRSGGFTVPGPRSRVDVEIEPLTIPPGGRFGASVHAASGEEVVSVATEGLSDGRLDFRFAVTDAVALSGVVLRYRLGGRVVFEVPVDFSTLRRGGRIEGSGGTGDGEPGSTHVVRSGGKYIVVADSEEPAARRRGGCPGFLVTPPPPLDAEFPAPICTDWVEVEPIVQAPMPEGEVSVTARGVGRFVVRELAAPSGATGQ